MAALLITLAVLVVLLLIALATASLLAYAYATALTATTAERDEARADLRTAHRTEREIRAELSVRRRLDEQHTVASAALTPDALPTQADRDLDLCEHLYALPATTDHDTQES